MTEDPMFIKFFSELIDFENKEDIEIFGKYKTRLYPPVVTLALYVHKCLTPSGSYDKALDKYQQTLPEDKQESVSGHNGAIFKAVRKFVSQEVIEIFLRKIKQKA